MKVLNITATPLKLQPHRRFYGFKSCVGRWTPESVDTGDLFYVACSHFAMLRFVSIIYNPVLLFIVERQIKKLEDKHYPMSISCKSSEIK